MYVVFNMGIICYGVLQFKLRYDTGNLLVPPPYISHTCIKYRLTLIFVMLALNFYECCHVRIYENHSESSLGKLCSSINEINISFTSVVHS